MTTKRFHVDNLLKETLKKEDRVKLPEDREFYENMQKNIMAAIVQTELEIPEGVDKTTKWSKPWVFLEPGTRTALEEGAVKLQANKKI